MRTLLLSSLLAVIFVLGINQSSYAFCDFVGPNGAGNIISCTLPIQSIPLNEASTPPNNTTDEADIVTIADNAGVLLNPAIFLGSAIDTAEGNDMVTTSGNAVNSVIGIGLSTTYFGLTNDNDTVIINDGATIRGGTGLLTGAGADSVTMNGGTVEGLAIAAMFTGLGPDMVTIHGGLVDGGIFRSFDTGIDSDTLTINDGTFNGPITMGSGSDTAFINGGTFSVLSLGMGSGDDTIHITDDVPGIDLFSCGENLFGPSDNDTLILSMQVPADQVAQLSQDFIDAGEDGSLEVNGITYTWVDCENRVPNFNGVVTFITLSPIAAENPIGTDHTVDAVVNSTAGVQPGALVTFEVDSGPNAGLNSGSNGFCSPNPDCTSDANGEVSWTYTSNGIIGTDTIVASIDDQFLGTVVSNTVAKDWLLVRNVPTLSEWGLIAMAGLLGIVGFMVVRRRQLSA